MSSKLDIFISAAEPSGDLHGEKILKSLQRRSKNLQIGGILGPKMRQCSATCFFKMESLAVMGFIDIIKSLPKLVWLFFKIRKKILKLNPKLVILIDYPDFHLRLEKSLKKKKYQGKLVHFVCPTVWAWNQKRIHLIEQNIDHLLVIFPFEKKYFKQTNLQVDYVGHPLIKAIETHLYDPTWQVSHKKKILAIFPGSRSKEITRNLPLQLDAAQWLQKTNPELEITISIYSHETQKIAEKIAQKLNAKVQFVPSANAYNLMKNCFLAIATSGTVTLELALHHIPTVVTFPIKFLDLILAQKILKIDLPFYCIVNIICNRPIFPELFGPNCTKSPLRYWLKALYSDPVLRKTCIDGCKNLTNILGNKDSMDETCKILFKKIF